MPSAHPSGSKGGGAAAAAANGNASSSNNLSIDPSFKHLTTSQLLLSSQFKSLVAAQRQRRVEQRSSAEMGVTTLCNSSTTAAASPSAHHRSESRRGRAVGGGAPQPQKAGGSSLTTVAAAPAVMRKADVGAEEGSDAPVPHVASPSSPDGEANGIVFSPAPTAAATLDGEGDADTTAMAMAGSNHQPIGDVSHIRHQGEKDAGDDGDGEAAVNREAPTTHTHHSATPTHSNQSSPSRGKQQQHLPPMTVARSASPHTAHTYNPEARARSMVRGLFEEVRQDVVANAMGGKDHRYHERYKDDIRVRTLTTVPQNDDDDDDHYMSGGEEGRHRGRRTSSGASSAASGQGPHDAPALFYRPSANSRRSSMSSSPTTHGAYREARHGSTSSAAAAAPHRDEAEVLEEELRAARDALKAVRHRKKVLRSEALEERSYEMNRGLVKNLSPPAERKKKREEAAKGNKIRRLENRRTSMNMTANAATAAEVYTSTNNSAFLRPLPRKVPEAHLLNCSAPAALNGASSGGKGASRNGGATAAAKGATSIGSGGGLKSADFSAVAASDKQRIQQQLRKDRHAAAAEVAMLSADLHAGDASRQGPTASLPNSVTYGQVRNAHHLARRLLRNNRPFRFTVEQMGSIIPDAVRPLLADDPLHAEEGADHRSAAVKGMRRHGTPLAVGGSGRAATPMAYFGVGEQSTLVSGSPSSSDVTQHKVAAAPPVDDGGDPLWQVFPEVLSYYHHAAEEDRTTSLRLSYLFLEAGLLAGAARVAGPNTERTIRDVKQHVGPIMAGYEACIVAGSAIDARIAASLPPASASGGGADAAPTTYTPITCGVLGPQQGAPCGSVLHYLIVEKVRRTPSPSPRNGKGAGGGGAQRRGGSAHLASTSVPPRPASRAKSAGSPVKAGPSSPPAGSGSSCASIYYVVLHWTVSTAIFIDDRGGVVDEAAAAAASANVNNANSSSNAATGSSGVDGTHPTTSGQQQQQSAEEAVAQRAIPTAPLGTTGAQAHAVVVEAATVLLPVVRKALLAAINVPPQGSAASAEEENGEVSPTHQQQQCRTIVCGHGASGALAVALSALLAPAPPPKRRRSKVGRRPSGYGVAPEDSGDEGGKERDDAAGAEGGPSMPIETARALPAFEGTSTANINATNSNSNKRGAARRDSDYDDGDSDGATSASYSYHQQQQQREASTASSAAPRVPPIDLASGISAISPAQRRNQRRAKKEGGGDGQRRGPIRICGVVALGSPQIFPTINDKRRALQRIGAYSRTQHNNPKPNAAIMCHFALPLDPLVQQPISYMGGGSGIGMGIIVPGTDFTPFSVQQELVTSLATTMNATGLSGLFEPRLLPCHEADINDADLDEVDTAFADGGLNSTRGSNSFSGTMDDELALLVRRKHLHDLHLAALQQALDKSAADRAREREERAERRKQKADAAARQAVLDALTAEREQKQREADEEQKRLEAAAMGRELVTSPRGVLSIDSYASPRSPSKPATARQQVGAEGGEKEGSATQKDSPLKTVGVTILEGREAVGSSAAGSSEVGHAAMMSESANNASSEENAHHHRDRASSVTSSVATNAFNTSLGAGSAHGGGGGAGDNALFGGDGDAVGGVDVADAPDYDATQTLLLPIIHSTEAECAKIATLRAYTLCLLEIAKAASLWLAQSTAAAGGGGGGGGATRPGSAAHFAASVNSAARLGSSTIMGNTLYTSGGGGSGGGGGGGGPSSFCGGVFAAFAQEAGIVQQELMYEPILAPTVLPMPSAVGQLSHAAVEALPPAFRQFLACSFMLPLQRMYSPSLMAMERLAIVFPTTAERVDATSSTPETAVDFYHATTLTAVAEDAARREQERAEARRGSSKGAARRSASGAKASGVTLVDGPPHQSLTATTSRAGVGSPKSTTNVSAKLRGGASPAGSPHDSASGGGGAAAAAAAGSKSAATHRFSPLLAKCLLSILPPSPSLVRAMEEDWEAAEERRRLQYTNPDAAQQAVPDTGKTLRALTKCYATNPSTITVASLMALVRHAVTVNNNAFEPSNAVKGVGGKGLGAQNAAMGGNASATAAASASASKSPNRRPLSKRADDNRPGSQQRQRLQEQQQQSQMDAATATPFGVVEGASAGSSFLQLPYLSFADLCSRLPTPPAESIEDSTTTTIGGGSPSASRPTSSGEGARGHPLLPQAASIIDPLHIPFINSEVLLEWAWREYCSPLTGPRFIFLLLSLPEVGVTYGHPPPNYNVTSFSDLHATPRRANTPPPPGGGVGRHYQLSGYDDAPRQLIAPKGPYHTYHKHHGCGYGPATWAHVELIAVAMAKRAKRRMSRPNSPTAAATQRSLGAMYYRPITPPPPATARPNYLELTTEDGVDYACVCSTSTKLTLDARGRVPPAPKAVDVLRSACERQQLLEAVQEGWKAGQRMRFNPSDAAMEKEKRRKSRAASMADSGALRGPLPITRPPLLPPLCPLVQGGGGGGPSSSRSRTGSFSAIAADVNARRRSSTSTVGGGAFAGGRRGSSASRHKGGSGRVILTTSAVTALRHMFGRHCTANAPVSPIEPRVGEEGTDCNVYTAASTTSELPMIAPPALLFECVRSLALHVPMAGIDLSMPMVDGASGVLTSDVLTSALALMEADVVEASRAAREETLRKGASASPNSPTKSASAFPQPKATPSKEKEAKKVQLNPLRYFTYAGELLEDGFVAFWQYVLQLTSDLAGGPSSLGAAALGILPTSSFHASSSPLLPAVGSPLRSSSIAASSPASPFGRPISPQQQQQRGASPASLALRQQIAGSLRQTLSYHGYVDYTLAFESIPLPPLQMSGALSAEDAAAMRRALPTAAPSSGGGGMGNSSRAGTPQQGSRPPTGGGGASGRIGGGGSRVSSASFRPGTGGGASSVGGGGGGSKKNTKSFTKAGKAAEEEAAAYFRANRRLHRHMCLHWAFTACRCQERHDEHRLMARREQKALRVLMERMVMMDAAEGEGAFMAMLRAMRGPEGTDAGEGATNATGGPQCDGGARERMLLPPIRSPSAATAFADNDHDDAHDGARHDAFADANATTTSAASERRRRKGFADEIRDIATHTKAFGALPFSVLPESQRDGTTERKVAKKTKKADEGAKPVTDSAASKMAPPSKKGKPHAAPSPSPSAQHHHHPSHQHMGNMSESNRFMTDKGFVASRRFRGVYGTTVPRLLNDQQRAYLGLPPVVPLALRELISRYEEEQRRLAAEQETRRDAATAERDAQHRRHHEEEQQQRQYSEDGDDAVMHHRDADGYAFNDDGGEMIREDDGGDSSSSSFDAVADNISSDDDLIPEKGGHIVVGGSYGHSGDAEPMPPSSELQ